MKQLNSVIIVSNDEKDLNFWEEELKGCNCCQITMTDSILDAIKCWNKYYVNGQMPKAIITNWSLENREVETMKDGIIKSGSHYMIDYCCSMLDELEKRPKFFVYTNSPDFVKEQIKGLRESEDTVILSKDSYSFKDVFEIVKNTALNIRTSSGFHSINA